MIVRPTCRSMWCATLAACLTFSSAAAAAQDPDPGVDTDPVASEARALYEQGRSAYNSSDYERSVDLFRAAFERAEKIESEELRLRVLTTLWFNLARAQVKAFDIDQDPRRLRQAKDLISKYLRDTALSPDERAEAEAVDAEIDARLGGPASPRGSDSENGPSSGPPGDETPPKQKTGSRGDSPGRPLMVTGAVVAGVGALAGGALIGVGGATSDRSRSEYEDATTPAGRERALDDFERARTVGIAGIAVGSALVVTGAALIAVGVVKQRKARVSPMAGRGTYGVALSMSF